MFPLPKKGIWKSQFSPKSWELIFYQFMEFEVTWAGGGRIEFHGKFSQSNNKKVDFFFFFFSFFMENIPYQTGPYFLSSSFSITSIRKVEGVIWKLQGVTKVMNLNFIQNIPSYLLLKFHISDSWPIFSTVFLHKFQVFLSFIYKRLHTYNSNI